MKKKKFYLNDYKTKKIYGPKVYDIPDEFWKFIKKDKLVFGSNAEWYRYQKKLKLRIENLFKLPEGLQQGLVNTLRISKAVWIEKQPITGFEKSKMHQMMCHNYTTTQHNYLFNK